MSLYTASVSLNSVWDANLYRIVINLYLFVLLSASCSISATELKCQLQYESCWCADPNGNGLNLTKINQWYSAKKGEETFWFRPCPAPGDSSSVCSSSAMVCVVNDVLKVHTDLGFQNNTVAVHVVPDMAVDLRYNYTNRTTSVRLSCSPAGSETNFTVSSAKDGHYELLMASPQLCMEKLATGDVPDDPATLSTGSVLVIMFFVFSALYLVGGALVLKLLRGAQGREMIPNYEFWSSLPGLVKEGVMFTMSGCQTPQAYDRI